MKIRGLFLIDWERFAEYDESHIDFIKPMGDAMKSKLLVLSLSGFLFFFGCSEKKDARMLEKQVKSQTQSELFSDIKDGEKIYLSDIMAHWPQGILALNSQIALHFQKDIIPAHLIDQVLTNQPVSFDPPIAGHAKWLDRKTLIFIPDEDLKMDTEYEGLVNGKLLLGYDDSDNFKFRFSTPKQQVRDFEYDFVPVGTGKEGEVKLSATFSFYNQLELMDFQEDLDLRLEGRKWSFIIHSYTDTEFHLESSPIPRRNIVQFLKISLPPKYTPTQKPWTKSLPITEMGKFKILTSGDMSDNENIKQYGIRFSENISTDMDISGFVQVQPEIDYELIVRDKYLVLKAEFLAGKKYSLKILEGLPSADGRKLETAYFKTITFSNIKPEIKWISEGVFLPKSNQNTLQFTSVNLKKVEVTIHQIYEENMGFFLQENNLASVSNYYDLYRVGEEVYKKRMDIDARRNIWMTNSIDIGRILGKNPNTGYIVSLQFDQEDLLYPVVGRIEDVSDKQLYYEDSDDYYSNPMYPGYYYDKGQIHKLVLLSQIALTAKKTSEGVHVFALDILKAGPVAGLSLDLYNFQNKIIETVKTDRYGYAVFKSEKGYTVRGKGAVIKLNGKQWETSNFDVAGATKGKKGLKIFMYTDRGVYRPGDTVHFSSILRTDFKIPPEDQPVILKLRNPLDQVVAEQKTTVGKFGHCSFDLPVAPNAPTGNWKAELHFAGEVTYHWLKIETVKPNRIKVRMDFPEKIVGSPLKLTGKITSRYLFGAPGKGLPVLGEMVLTAREPKIKGYENYNFYDPMLKFETRERIFVDGELNESGEFSVDYAFKKEVENTSGLNAQLKITVSEKGGSQVSEYQNILVMPARILPGIRQSEPFYLKRNNEYHFPIVVAHLDGNLVPGHKLEVTHYVNQHYWWWEYHENETEKDFRKLEHTIELESMMMISESAPLDYVVNTSDYGFHYIHVRDLETGQCAGARFHVSWWGDRQDEKDEKQQDFLNIALDQEKYTPGDIAKISFDSPAKGTYLFTLEQDGKILEKRVDHVSPGRTNLNLPVTEAMVPNCYAVISLIQPHDRTGNDIPIRSFGIKTVFVEEPSTRLEIEMEVPKEVRPKEDFEITIKNNSRQNASATIAIVDNGLLDLTNFQTPGPWDFYYQKLRLGISTLDNYDEIIGMLLPDVDNEYTIGGGMAMKSEMMGGLNEVQQIRRFKAAVIFKQLPELKAGEEKKFKFTMPDYIGSMRVMLVGCSEKGFFSREKEMIVKTPLLVLPTIPRAVHPGDRFKLPVSVFALEDSIREVEVDLAVSDHLTILGENKQYVTFDKKGDREVFFEVSTNEIIGGAKITLTAKSADETTLYTVDLPVRSSNPYMTEVTDTILHNKGQITFIPEKIGFENTNSAKLVFARIPDIKLEKHLNYLIRYPYGCLEQTTSSVFAQLVLKDLMDLNSQQEQNIHQLINRGIERLALFMNSAGFSYWPGGTTNASWCTAYTGHFIFAAKELGYHIPSDLENHWLKTAQRQCKQLDKKDYRYQAYTLFVLAFSENPEFGTMNLLRENELGKMDIVSKTLLATAYYIAGKQDVARTILQQNQPVVAEYRELAGTYGSRLRDQAMLAYCAILMNDLDKANRLIKSITDAYKKQEWFSTQELSFTLLALSKYYAKSDFSLGDVPFAITVEGQTEAYMLTDYMLEVDATPMFGKEVKIQSKADGPLFVYLYESGTPMKDIVKTESKGFHLSRTFFDDNGNVVSADTLEQGKSVWIVYYIQSETRENIEEVALSAMVPSGWEIINPRLSEEQLPEWMEKLRLSYPEYLDIRDDRINWFFDIYGNDMKFAVKINPTFKGDYILPPVNLEAMYSPDYYSRIKSGRVVVK
ncbi:MAG: hypothetical protein JXQ65_08065 [Candidatus Marinimicrobia bacterium]|nr:hypothetical protein [Candidatus Neomarinimicrobiota bacterium]